MEGDGFASRVASRLERLDLTPDAAARAAGLPPGTLTRLLEGQAPPPRGTNLVKLADALATSVSYLVGLDPDSAVPPEYLQEDQGTLGLLAADEEALLRTWRRLDLPTRAALLHLLRKLSPDPVPADERKPIQARRPEPMPGSA